MLVVRTRAEVGSWIADCRAGGATVALVPTMGSLHPGHLSLVEIAAAAGARVGVSIFVNPLQFGADEDFDRYPRDLERDLELAEDAGVALVFAPSVQEMYPSGEPWVTVVPERGSDSLCGRSRPGHFRGVLTVVAKLFGIFSADLAVFGQKDYQQLALIRRMVADLNMPLEIVGGPIVRDPDGLAMSSRNRYLSAEDRRRALALVNALDACHHLFQSGEGDAAAYRRLLHDVQASGVSVEYGEVVHPLTLEALDRVDQGSVCAIAGRVGSTRLIDNLILGTGSPLDLTT
jgi:pantoate--beta-alanine ligase